MKPMPTPELAWKAEQAHMYPDTRGDLVSWKMFKKSFSNHSFKDSLKARNLQFNWISCEQTILTIFGRLASERWVVLWKRHCDWTNGNRAASLGSRAPLTRS